MEKKDNALIKKTKKFSVLKNHKKINRNFLIKRRNLILKLKEAGIRSSPEAVWEIEKHLQENIAGIIEGLKEELVTHGRKTLKKEDVQKIFEKKEENFEV